jgi:hypothetical protein
MDQITRNPRVIAIHLGRVDAHLKEAFRELNRIDPAAFAPDILTALQKATAQVWADALELANVPVILPEPKPKKAGKVKELDATPPANPILLLTPTPEVEAPAEAITDESEADLAEGPYDSIEAKFDNA